MQGVLNVEAGNAGLRAFTQAFEFNSIKLELSWVESSGQSSLVQSGLVRSNQTEQNFIYLTGIHLSWQPEVKKSDSRVVAYQISDQKNK